MARAVKEWPTRTTWTGDWLASPRPCRPESFLAANPRCSCYAPEVQTSMHGIVEAPDGPSQDLDHPMPPERFRATGRPLRTAAKPAAHWVPRIPSTHGRRGSGPGQQADGVGLRAAIDGSSDHP